ncbi:MAG TPA: BREX system ATP-binding protein BrxD [Pirellulaceae bacterium]|nr:BREX system ATP-binding protein BrxD [Pirellulaceae bacterium]
MSLSPKRREEIIDALRRGTVPRNSLDAFATGLDRFRETLDDELRKVSEGSGGFKAIRGDYGCGKTFFTRWLADRARQLGFATSEVQVSETETPLHRLETVYRRSMERLATTDSPQGALRNIVDGWFFALEEDVLAEGRLDPSDTAGLLARTSELMEQRLAKVTATAPLFAAALRGYREARGAGDGATAEGLLAWLAGQPNVAASVKRPAGLKGDIDHFGALSFLQGMLVVLRDSGSPGLLLVLDEVETIQRVRGDVRDKSLNALRQWLDEIDSGRFPGLMLVITGTPAFFDGPQGVQRLAPLAQRLHVDFATDARFDNPRSVQLRLAPFTIERLVEVGRRVRDIFAEGAKASDRVRARVDDDFIRTLAERVTGDLGGKVGIAPRIFLKKLVADLLDRVELFDDFDPRQHYRLTIAEGELEPRERAARGAIDVDEIELD